ncbi:MAG: STT3 domain-containing protein, partial [Candidatus Hermodarchaeota archaeon]
APDLIPFGLSKRLESVLSPLVRDSLHIVASVAEHMPSSWSTFYYSTLIPLMLLPLGLFFLFKRANVPEILFITFLILIFYFTGSMIRIILLFAPAACLVGAYGLVNVLKIFGSFYEEKRADISRKRRRQLKRTVGKSEIGTVYIIVGIMCFAQIVQASDMAITSLSQSQIAPGGNIHDWEESLTWMKSNLPGSTVVVSWWDYGYWLTPIGNMTTVNDNATINQTRIGLTGMAMMQTNELYSAMAFKRLHADYVLVYFGGLYSPLGGDEGKWPWMLRICNDNYNTYKRWGMEEDNWAPNSVFLESDYWDDQQQAPENSWFDSTLVKLMFYGIPTDQLTTDPQNFMQYYQQQIYSRKDASGNTYVSHIPDGGQYDFIVFRPAYISSNGLVKLFKLDYTALESDFEIKDPAIYDSGFGTLKINNLGSKDLQITQVLVNGKSYDFKMGKGISTNILPKDESDLIWIDIKSSGDSYDVNDVVNVTVTAQSVALDNKVFTFDRYTDSFFVKQAPAGNIRINKANSNVIQIDDTTAEMYLEVENTGNYDVILDKFYIDTEENEVTDAEYLSGSPILEPGQTAYVKLTGITDTFYLDGTFHKIGIVTPNNIRDEILICSNAEGYEITILDDDRIVSPEISAFTHSDFRKHIPISLGDTSAYKYDNGTVTLQIRVKNTGDIILGLSSINITKTTSWEPVDIPEPFNLEPGQERVFNIIASDYLTGIEVNDEIGVIVRANFDGPTIASDIGYVHVLKAQPDLQIIDTIEGATTSYIAANETGQLLIKNTGIVPIELDSLYINETTILSFDSDITFESGDKTLDLQEAALVSFNIAGLKINQSNLLKLNVTTNTTASVLMDFTAIVDSALYNISIDDTHTSASDSGNLVITIDNLGTLNVTVEGVYINNTYVDLSNFEELIYEIGVGGSIELTIAMSIIESKIGAVNLLDDLKILIRTQEGAEAEHLEQVIL